MQALIDAVLHYRKTVLTILFCLCVIGIFSYKTIHKEAAPDVAIPLMFVQVAHQGISVTDAEDLLLKPLEAELKNLEGLKEIQGSAYEGGAAVILEFHAGFDPKEAHFNVREKVDLAKPKLPKESEEPILQELNVSLFPILTIQLHGDVPMEVLSPLARDLKDLVIQNVPSVLRVDMVGDRAEMLEILIDPVKVEQYGLNLQKIMGFFAQSNTLASAGSIENASGLFSMTVRGLVETPEDVLGMPVYEHGGRVVLFKDIGTARQTFKDATSYARFNGAPSVALQVVKRTGANIIETVATVRAVVEKAQRTFPPGIQVSFTEDESIHVEDMLTDLQESLILASLIVLLTLLLTLEFRLALLVAAAVPACFLITLSILQLMGITLNIMVLFSLIFAVGMLVDGAIIVVEYAERELAEGKSAFEAFRDASVRMAWPVVSTTVTILVVFMPLLFWPDVVGQFMRFMPLTLLVILSVSLVMALIFVPALGTVMYGFGRTLGAKEADHGRLTRLYHRFLIPCVDHPGKVILGALGLVIATFTLYKITGPAVHFFPDVEPERAAFLVRARGSLSIAEQDKLVRGIEADLAEMPEIAAGVRGIYARVGAQSSERGEGIPEDTIGRLFLEFKPWQERRGVEQIMRAIDARFKNRPGVIVEVQMQKAGPVQGKPIELVVGGDNLEILQAATQQLRDHLAGISGVTEVETDLPLPGLEVRLAVDRKRAAEFGLPLSVIAAQIQMLSRGVKLGTYHPPGRDQEADIVLRFPEKDRRLEHLAQLRIQSPKGLVPLQSFVAQEWSPRLTVLHRRNGERVYTVQADVAPGTAVDTVVTRLEAWLAADPLPPGVHVAFKGEAEQQQATAQFLMFSFVLVILLMFIIVLTQFNSFYSAFLVMSAVLFGVFGAILGYLLEHASFGIVMGGVGMVALAGVIVSNNIILIDTYDMLEKQMHDIRRAVIEASLQRLRPIILTHLTTVLGILPLMFGVNIQFLTHQITVGAPSSQWWTELSATIVYGLLFGSMMTLFVTPAALMLRGRRA
jgi:multidrug efflux pump